MKQLKLFDITQHIEEQEYLHQMHAKGWKFKHVTFPGIYSFEKVEPETMIYQLDYNPDGLKEKQEYVQMFKDCGWEYIQEFMGYSYFRKAKKEKEDESIFCDEQSRNEMINRVFKGRLVPMLFIFCGCIIPGILTGTLQRNKMILILYIVLFVSYLIIFIQFACFYFKEKDND
ncbi:DUF2812 domain-containing protein [Floccifex sp.]|uniref:DUF2812 domain-containing protein n=1 Tax=Floccifex sp. TaxID=2815810 RepID=UPI002A760C20|nr:DUF2812 domain-containing protein [Floccifex sp.]MDY2957722.1 DUF2812 domain-containing protein [Floccifex sp.]